MHALLTSIGIYIYIYFGGQDYISVKYVRFPIIIAMYDSKQSCDKCTFPHIYYIHNSI